jgi:voltage-gated potassium channel
MAASSARSHVNDPRGGEGGGRVRSRLKRRAGLAVTRGRVFPYLVAVTAATAVVTGLVAHLIDRKDFSSFGTGVWWAIVTLGTVGYGDVVPHTAWGRFLGGVVIIFGVTFISFLVAIVTSLFVDAGRTDEENATKTRHEETLALLRSLDARLQAIEKRQA